MKSRVPCTTLQKPGRSKHERCSSSELACSLTLSCSLSLTHACVLSPLLSVSHLLSLSHLLPLSPHEGAKPGPASRAEECPAFDRMARLGRERKETEEGEVVKNRDITRALTPVPLRESKFEVDISTDAREQQVLIFHHLLQPLFPLVAVVLSDPMDNAD